VFALARLVAAARARAISHAPPAQFTHLSAPEFASRFAAGARPAPQSVVAARVAHNIGRNFSAGVGGGSAAALPGGARALPPAAVTAGSVNWVTAGAVTPVEDQGQCGDCYAFAAMGALSSAMAIAQGGCTPGTPFSCPALTDLSSQQIADCSFAQGNNGCNGGYMSNAFEYVKANGGVCTEAAYPYTSGGTGVVGTCKVPSPNTCAPAANVQSTSFDYVLGAGGAPSLSVFLAYLTAGPVSVGVYAGCGTLFQNYAGGYFTATCQGSPANDVDHAVLATGFFTVPPSTQYVQLKNQYGTSWGGTP
jgi:hypothetical protein